MRNICIAISWATCALLLVPRESSAFLFSSTTTNTEVDVTQTAKRMAECSQFKLKEVQGAASVGERTYIFDGVCKIWIVRFTGGKQQGISGQASLWAYAEAKWKGQSNELQERMKLTDPSGKHTGDLQAKFKCMQDPIVQKTSCVRMHFSNGTDWTGFDVPADKGRPILTGFTTASEVAAMAKSAAFVGVKRANGSVDSERPAEAGLDAAKLNVPAGAIGKPDPKPTLPSSAPGRSQAMQDSGPMDTRASAPTAFDANRGTNLPAVQQPRSVETGRPAPGTNVGAPAANWSAMGAAPAGALGAPSPVLSTPPPIAAANVQQELAQASCKSAGGLRFSCATKAGFDQCEALRMRRRVDACSLELRR